MMKIMGFFSFLKPYSRNYVQKRKRHFNKNNMKVVNVTTINKITPELSICIPKDGMPDFFDRDEFQLFCNQLWYMGYRIITHANDSYIYHLDNSSELDAAWLKAYQSGLYLKIN